ncbi:MAG: hypothetical protein A2622_00770 [Bdellovibrionales bacterium RIFCSPHIGHO2_01_FULL_40_29]|nr:MAG: hypothetical protein A2622_00770 [Bdellovibrionales bacterium RIFCSPHIGHO2_01_FULL_40_29]OFZ32650.1 MAG: hypothetical protein A3D17_05370 [Bdellovibrionales bacterium RIFCSPHIGHO2_02_FULL_40_15]
MKKIQLKIKILLSFVLTLLFVLVSCQSSDKDSQSNKNLITPVSALQKSDPTEISIMTYNVENLFDTTHDKDREDFPNLPLAEKSKPEVIAFCSAIKSNYRRQECEQLDWNESVLKIKLQNVAAVIRTLDGGKGPDVLLVAEVENEAILKRLVTDQLAELGYQTVILREGPDLRGIDPGFISKFPLVGKPKLHLVPYTEADPEKLKWARRSRGILEATVKLPNKKSLTFLVGHFPSQSNPTEWRAQAVAFAKNLMAEKIKKGEAVVLGGDLNITERENESHGFFNKELSEVGYVSHLIGCKHCLGTHSYKGGWDFLDVLIFSKNLKDAGVELITDSFQVVRTSENMKRNGTPLSFDSTKKVMGVSDHFPLYSRLRLLK